MGNRYISPFPLWLSKCLDVGWQEYSAFGLEKEC